ncbi:MAG: 4-amino-4-deoxy-L-arabinose transferase-like glycosyltransferase [Alteromonas naphthalenivorans]|jgi:4-amino-4-deoxy-L-arabinose transferase-like glycosyltransferase
MNEKKVLLAGGLLYLGLSFALFNASPEDRAHKPVDGMGYHKIAMRFVEKGTLLSVSKSPLNHPIGYPFVLGLCYKLWGNEVWKIVLFQVFLMLLSLVIWYYIIKRLFDPQIAQYTYFLSIINLGLLIYPQLVLVESGQFFLYTLFFERLSQFYNSTKEKILLQAGFFLGLSVWLKPSALYFPLYCMPFLLVMWFLNRKNILYFFTYFAVGFYVPVGLYSLYNYSHFGYIKLSYIPEYGQYYFLHSKILKQINPSWSESKLRILIHSHFNTNYIRLDSRYWQGGALFLYQTCLQHPVLVLKHVGLNVVKTLIAPCITQWKIFLDPTSITPNTVSFFFTTCSLMFFPLSKIF